MGARALNPVQQQALNDALMTAVSEKDQDMMVSAIESGANPDLLLFNGITNQHLPWVKLAVEHGANVHASTAGLAWSDLLRSNRPYPVFFWLSQNFNAEVGDYLLAQGAQIDVPSPEGNSALLVAVKQRNARTIKYFVEKGADPLMLCDGQKFPLKELQDDHDWYHSSDKVPLIKAMMENLQHSQAPAAAAKTAANDAGAVTTKEDIEVIRPLELKKKPRTGFDL